MNKRARIGFVLLALFVSAVAVPHFSDAQTARQQGGRIVIDGFTDEFDELESIFKNPEEGLKEEPDFDSKWGLDNDFHQIRITWDKDTLYVAGEGLIWGNNMILFFDVIPGTGLRSMSELNSWRRGFSFSEDFTPDFFLATWDGNSSPRLLVTNPGDLTKVDDNLVGELFRASATFSGNLQGRSMEFAIPWNTFFLGTKGFGVTPTFVPSLGETLQVFPKEWGTIKIAGVITGGGDGSGGPDSAPDNTEGHVDDGNQPVEVNNYAMLEMDREDDSGLGEGGPDGVADWDINPRDRVTFKIQPPVEGIRFEIRNVTLDRPVLAPDRNEISKFKFTVIPALDPNIPADRERKVRMTANIYSVDGVKVRDLYSDEPRKALEPSDPMLDQWDGRDNDGNIVPAGVYILRLVQGTTSRLKKPIVVVR